jgi:hypothetical protein
MNRKNMVWVWTGKTTPYDKTYKTCTLDWQRHNKEWMTIDEGTLEDCIRIAEQSDWFQI